MVRISVAGVGSWTSSPLQPNFRLHKFNKQTLKTIETQIGPNKHQSKKSNDVSD